MINGKPKVRRTRADDKKRFFQRRRRDLEKSIFVLYFDFVVPKSHVDDRANTRLPVHFDQT